MKIYQSKGGGKGGHQELVSWIIDWKRNWLSVQLEWQGKWHSKTQGTAGKKFQETICRQARRIWKWSLQYRQVKSQTKGYFVHIQKLVAVWKAIQRSRMKDREVYAVNDKMTTSNIYVALDIFWGCSPNFTLTALWLFLLAVQKRCLKIREATHFVHGSTTKKWRKPNIY